MSIRNLLARLDREGARLALDTGRLRLIPAKGRALTADVVVEVREQRDALITFLRDAPQESPGPSRPSGPSGGARAPDATSPDSCRPDRPCRVCHGVGFWRHAVHGHWLCRRCHPPSFPEDVGEELTVEDPRPRAEWEAGDAELVAWFLEEGHRRIPAEPFHLTPWLEVTRPDVFAEALRFDVACGPDGPRARTAAIQDDIRRLKAFLERGRRG